MIAKTLHIYLWKISQKTTIRINEEWRCAQVATLSKFYPPEFPTKIMEFDQVIHISAELSTEN